MVQFLLVRRDDLVHIGLQFANFRLDQPAVTGGTRPRLVALDNASIAVTFPPQALSEDDFVWHDLSRRTFSIAAGSSRVTFTVPAGTALELTAKGVLTALQSPNVAVVPSAFGTANPPTAIEIPWKLLVTPVPRDVGAPGSSRVPILSKHPVQPATSPSAVTGLWRAQLRSPDGDATDADIAVLPLVNLDGDMPRPGHLTQDVREHIINQMRLHLSRPIARRFELTTIGGSLQVAGSWANFEWSQDVILGRDHKIRTSIGGVLYPFGHRALLTTVTEREFKPPGAASAAPNATDDPPQQFPKDGVAGLFSTSTLTIVERVHAFTHDSPHGRQFPFHEVEILGRTFLDIQPQFNPIIIIRDADGTAHQFALRCAGANADVVLTLPLLFVEDGVTGDATDLQNNWNEAAQEVDGGRPGVEGIAVALPGVPINMFPGAARQGDPRDLYALQEVVVDGAQEGGFFHPVLSQFTVQLPTLRALLQKPSVQAALSYTPDFLRVGDQVDVALAMAEQVGIDFTASPQRSGGLMAPSYKVDAISHQRGPVPNTGPLTDALPPVPPIVVPGSDQGPACMGLALDVGRRSIVLGIQRVELLIEPLLSGNPRIDRAANRFDRGSLHDRASAVDRSSLSRRPKKRGPFQRVPVMAKATLERLS